MKRIVAICLIVAFGMVCGAAWCERGRTDRPAEREGRDVRPQVEEVRKLAERLGELNQQLRGAMEQARENETVRRAFARVRELQAALNEAQARANAVLDMAVAQRNPRLVPLIREKNLIQKRLEELRSQSGERRERATEEGARRVPRTEREGER
ncbi:MAG: hypothetical protein Q8Q12_13560 [bacterium]|nr:hypothetical protein [bacterium]